MFSIMLLRDQSLVSAWSKSWPVTGIASPDLPDDELPFDTLPEPVNPVTVTIGGRKADILYAGAAPGLAGVIQINAREPVEIKPGTGVPVVVMIGGGSSQAGVTLAVQ